MLAFIFINHFFACVWTFIFKYDNPENALYQNYVYTDAYEEYLMGFYFGITILTTVGYGDVHG